VQTSFISVGNDFQDGDLEGFLDIVHFLQGEGSPPQVITTSYGQDEGTISLKLAQYASALEICISLTPLFRTLCNAYTALSSRGVSILFASGDGGVSGSQNESCSTFSPTFPSGCPLSVFLSSLWEPHLRH
jgi:tripeptidyl-peptidase-1